ncbi:MAG: hypothetical protein JKY22_10710 [Flavobacteriaceae bacterium]|nr:hypothetical protein [Flavobacteriaceae bacterium]
MKKFIRSALIVYLLTWLGMFLLIVIIIAANGETIWDSVKFFAATVVYASFLKGIHLIFCFIFGLFLLIKYFIITFRKKGIKIFLKRLTLFVLLPVTILITSYKSITHLNSQEDFNYTWDTSAENQIGISNNHYQNDGKHRGMSVFGWWGERKSAVNDLVKTNVEWVAVIPFIDQDDEQTATVNIRDNYDKWSRRDSIFIKTITDLHDKGIHVQLKPHLWLKSGWRSNINFERKDHWDTWFESYRINMLHYAKMAQKTEVELLCIGTELKTSISKQPEKWNKLISEIKAIYNGKLTYAANWDGDYDVISFWNQMDYIGIQAYFPLTNAINPDLETIKMGWDTHIEMLEKLADKYKKPILFTEIGYKSEASSTIKPWEWETGLGLLYREKSDRTQMLAYEALFQKLWKQDWFAGIYIWQWNTQSKPKNALKSVDFSPRFKPAENVITKWFGQNLTPEFPFDFIPLK